MPVYATQADYESSPYGATPAPADIANRLAVASDDIDEVAKTAVYDIDEDGLPTKPAVAEALKQATIAQARYTKVRGDDLGTGRTATAVGIGSASVKYGSGTTGAGSAAGRFAPRAQTLLRNAGLIPHVIYRPGG